MGAKKSNHPVWSLGEAVAACRQEQVVLYPTETLWGIGGDALSRVVARRILQVKRIPTPRPFPVLVDSRERALSVMRTEIPGVKELVHQFWPGSLTLVVPVTDGRLAAVAGDQGRVGLRLSGLATATALAKGVGGFLLSTSANRTGEPPAHQFQQIHPEVVVACDGVVDVRAVSSGEPSTILLLDEGRWRCVRHGAVDLKRIEEVLGTPGWLHENH